jgi:hypothetical protein
VSADGNRVLFTSGASNLVSGDTNAQPDAFVHYLHTAETIRISVGPGGQLADGGTASGLSPNGVVALFTSTDAIAGASAATDSNTVADVFARTLG